MADMAMLLGKAGFALFTLGLALGATIPRLRNPRMALSAHLTAVQGGMALMIFGLCWPTFGIAQWATRPIALSLTLSSYVLVAALVLAALTGASRALPIAGQGFTATPRAEQAVSVLTIGASVWLLLTCLAILGYYVMANDQVGLVTPLSP